MKRKVVNTIIVSVLAVGLAAFTGLLIKSNMSAGSQVSENSGSAIESEESPKAKTQPEEIEEIDIIEEETAKSTEKTQDAAKYNADGSRILTEEFEEDILVEEENGIQIITLMKTNKNVSMVKLYADGILTQKAAYDINNSRIYSEGILPKEDVEEMGSEVEGTAYDDDKQITNISVNMTIEQIENGEASTDYERFKEFGADEFLEDELGTQADDELLERAALEEPIKINTEEIEDMEG